MELGQYRRFRNDSEKLGTLTYRNKSQQIVWVTCGRRLGKNFLT